MLGIGPPVRYGLWDFPPQHLQMARILCATQADTVPNMIPNFLVLPRLCSFLNPRYVGFLVRSKNIRSALASPS